MENRCPLHADDPREVWRLNCPACWDGEMRRVGGERRQHASMAAQLKLRNAHLTARIAALERENEGLRRIVADVLEIELTARLHDQGFLDERFYQRIKAAKGGE